MRNEARLWQAIEGIEILHAHYTTHSFSRHTHDAFVISVIDRGEGAFWYRGSMRASLAGCLGLLNPAEPHTGRVVGASWSYRAFYISPSRWYQLASEVSEKPWSGCWFPEPIVRDPQLARSLRSLHRILVEPNSTLERESALHVVLARILMQHTEYPPTVRSLGREHQAVRRVREYIEANYADNLSLHDLAAVANLSSFHLSQVFRQTVGLPPHAYLNQVRVVRAKAMLAAGEPIARVAHAIGFVDQSHLNRRFKQILGCTPGQLVRL